MPTRTLRTSGHLWGPQRVRLGLSIRELAKLSGVNRGTLSLVEQGRLVPTGNDYQRVADALESIRQSTGTVS